MILVGLTGSIATGKSTVARVLAGLGAVIIDADVLARQAVAPGSAGLARVAERFGPGVVDETGNLDRAALRELIFSDSSARRDLEAIIHPIVQSGQEERIARARAADPTAVVVVDIPLLFEVGRTDDFDALVVAYVDRPTQIQRLMDRDGCDRRAAEAAVASQIDIEDKKARAEFMIDNRLPLEEARQQVERVYRELKKRAEAQAE